MAEPNQETAPPTVNTPRPTLQERAAQRRPKPSAGFTGYLAFLWKAVSLVAVVFGAFYVFLHVLTNPGEPARAPVAGVVVSPGHEGARAGPSSSVAVSPAEPKPEPEDLEARQRQIEYETAQGVQRQKLALAKLKQRQVIDQGGTVAKALDDWKSELDRWESEVVTLVKEDKGKPLAGNKPLLKRFRAVYERERSGKEEVERLRSQTEAVIAAVKLANDTPSDGSSPPEGVTTELQGLLRQAREGRDLSRIAREQIASIVKQAKSGTPGAPGTKTLAEASSEQQDEERLASAAVIEAETAKAREQATRRKAAAEVERVASAAAIEAEALKAREEGKRRTAAAEVERLASAAAIAVEAAKAREEAMRRTAAAEVERVRSEEAATARIAKLKADQTRELELKEEARLQAETRMLKAKADQARIRRLAEDPAILAQFAPFLAKGKWQWMNGAAMGGDIPEPASYKALMNSGCLRNEKTFASAMAGYGYFGSHRVRNDRPHVPYPSSEQGMRRMAQLFELFKELAPTWIETAKLSP